MENQQTKHILDIIKEKNIKPRPRWEFWLANAALWVLFVCAIVVGSFATSVIIFMALHTDWTQAVPEFSPLHRLFLQLPYVWLVVLLLFLALGYYNVRHTKKGYKYHPYLVLIISIAISMLFGLVLYIFGGGERLEELTYRRVPVYQYFVQKGFMPFVAPERGMLGGVVQEIGGESIQIIDFNGQLWVIPTTSQTMAPGQRVRIIGELGSDHHFEAKMISPWFRRQPPPGILFFSHRQPPQPSVEPKEIKF